MSSKAYLASCTLGARAVLSLAFHTFRSRYQIWITPQEDYYFLEKVPRSSRTSRT